MVEPVTGSPAFQAFETREAAADHVATLIEGALRQQLAVAGRASLLLSGGSTPGPVFERLSAVGLDWASVSIGLVDERWVPEEDSRSNAALIKRTLLKDAAAEAQFEPMYTGAPDPAAGESQVEATYRLLFEAPPIMLLGMGPDGHTASWFPGTENLEVLLDPNAVQLVGAVDATDAPVAGDMPHRMTINAHALVQASLTVLYITGEDKRGVLEDRAATLPIHHAERLLGSRLKEVWAP
jgi:6-phosphogluconolactonase